MRTLDLPVLRTLVAVIDSGTLAAAALRVGRSESAVSLQLKKLEDMLGEAVFDRTRRKVALTDAGMTILGYARRLLDLNDEALQAAGAHGLDGEVSLGVPQDFAETWLPAMIGRFRRSHRAIKVNVTVDRSPSLQSRVARGELDLAMAFTGATPAASTWSAGLPMAWIGRADFRRRDDEPVSLAVFDPPCAFRTAAAAALDRAGIGWGVSFTSPSLASLWAAVDAGLGITVRTPTGKPPHLAVIGRAAGLPDLPRVHLALHAAPSLSAAAAQLQRVLQEGLKASLAGGL
jgi:DNA-binding transcriptional LysR family regulator